MWYIAYAFIYIEIILLLIKDHLYFITHIFWQFNKWVTFAENFLLDPEACSKSLTQLNEYLTEKAVLVGGGFTPSEADIIVFSTVHPSVVCNIHIL